MMSIPSLNNMKPINSAKMWSDMKKGGYMVAALVLIGGQLYVRKKYPAQGIEYKPNEEKVDALGRKKVFIGYTGHHKDTQMSKDRLVFFDPNGKETAQIYAKKNLSGGAVFSIWGDEKPTDEDLEKKTYYINNGRAVTPIQLYTALTPEGMKRLNVEFGPPEEVTYKTDLISLFAPWVRCYQDIKTKCW